MIELLRVEDIVKHYAVRRGSALSRRTDTVHALDGISFMLGSGRTLALVGESGSGKSTAAKVVLRLTEPTSGRVRFEGTDIGALDGWSMRRLRARMQMVFQDPYESLNPRMRVGDIVAEPLLVGRAIGEMSLTGEQVRRRAFELLAQVGLDGEFAVRYPHQLSSGQRQRVGIARALALGPKLVVCDEPVSALDVSIRTQVLLLLRRLQQELNLAYLFISHDLAVVRQVADRVGVMYLGKIVEMGDAAPVYAKPYHPYTQALLSAVPIPDPVVERERRRIVLSGEIPSAAAPPSGCRFHTRCPIAQEVCGRQEPTLDEMGGGHRVACHFAKANPIPV